ncbi:MAG TPA: hypothetical protein VGX28_02905 [Frankiaceae bacterium]|nr:hypothetical protein [Frankiaceae bacterium]
MRRARVLAVAVATVAAVAAPSHAYETDDLYVTGSGVYDVALDTTSRPHGLSIYGNATGIGNHGILASYPCVLYVAESAGTLAAGAGQAHGSCGYVWCLDSISARTGLVLTLTCPPGTTTGSLTCVLTPAAVGPVRNVAVDCQGSVTRV